MAGGSFKEPVDLNPPQLFLKREERPGRGDLGMPGFVDPVFGDRGELPEPAGLLEFLARASACE